MTLSDVGAVFFGVFLALLLLAAGVGILAVLFTEIGDD